MVLVWLVSTGARTLQFSAAIAIVLTILVSLPHIFRDSRAQPFWADLEGDTARGFLALKETSPYTAELAVMGVLPEYHRRGIGRALFAAFRQYAQAHGCLFLQVKTVQEGIYPIYDQTNAFYRSLGFRELECFPTLWDEANPCQIYVMSLH